MQIQTAIIQFLSNEFKMEPDNLNPDTSFSADLGLSPDALSDLFQRLQDSLNISLPEDKVAGITTVGQLLEAVSEEDHETDL